MATITAKQLAAEMEITPKALRRKLRKAYGEDHAKGTRWEFTRKEADEAKAKVAAPAATDED